MIFYQDYIRRYFFMYQFNQQPFYGQPYQQMQPGMNVYGMPAPAYYGGNQAQQQPLFKNYLTPEQIAELQMNPDSFSTKLTRREYLGSICLHKNEQNQVITLEKLPSGTHRCSICQDEFYLMEPETPMDDVNQICNRAIDLLQSIKTYSLQPSDELRNIFMMIGFMKRLPYLWQKTVKAFEQAVPVNGLGMQQQDPNANAFQVLGSVFGGGIIPGTGYNQGFYQQPAQVPQMAMYSQPGFAPQATPGLPQAPVQQPTYDPNQQYGFNTQTMVQQPQGVPANGYQQPMTQQPPPPPGYPNPASNPIGYVEPTQMATQNVQIGGQQPPQQPIAPAPQPATNPNIQTPAPNPVIAPPTKK